MKIPAVIWLLSLVVAMLLVADASAAQRDSLVIERADWTEVKMEGGEYVILIGGDVRFRAAGGLITCDSAVYRRGRDAWLRGNVVVDDTAYTLRADSAHYRLDERITDAWGDFVELKSFTDSIYAVGPNAHFERANRVFWMSERPTLYLNYPDTNRMVEVLADSIHFEADNDLADAVGNVYISTKDLNSHSDLAVMNMASQVLELTGVPTATYKNSRVSGNEILVTYTADLLDSIVVNDSARGDFKEAVGTDTTEFDESVLSGERLLFDFVGGRLDNIMAQGQAYSWYYPSSQGSGEYHENSVSGDTIQFILRDQDDLQAVRVTGGAVGSYMHGKGPRVDSLGFGPKPDTVDYSSEEIEYNLEDSLILLHRQASVTSGDVSLTAREVKFDTRGNIVEAFAADIVPDTVVDPYSFTVLAQPARVPVVLLDKEEELIGDYLVYSLDTKKGRIVQSKTAYDPGWYYGRNLFREGEGIFYIHQGRFTTCDHEEPHFHFRATDLKLIQDEKLIARPVVAYLGRMPVLALPYYVFPLKRGRHSGFLPFEFGNFERDVRYVSNVGYYWAASEYWDWQGAVDYYDNDRAITFRTKMNFAKRYVITGTYLDAGYTSSERYNTALAQEERKYDYYLRGRYNHQLSPTLKIGGTADYVSSSDYFGDYSNNLDDRLNRELKSTMSLSKQFSNGVKITAEASHTENLDEEYLIDKLPNVNVSLPTIFPFGSASGDERRWYHGFTFSYNPSLKNYFRRDTEDSTFVADTLFTNDSTWTDTGYVYYVDTTEVEDTAFWHTRKKYSRIDHSPSLSLPKITLGPFLSLIPTLGYQETWYRIPETDQSEEANIPPGDYRAYSWNASLRAQTKLYGTVYPRLWVLQGLRHEVTPSVTYTYRPDIDMHPEVRSYAGGGPGSSKSQILGFSLDQVFLMKALWGEEEKNLELLSLESDVSYDLEKDSLNFSDMKTSFRSNVLPKVSLSGSMTHSLYKPGTSELSFWSPYMEAFSFNASVNFGGPFPFFDEPADAKPDLAGSEEAPQGQSKSKKGVGKWTCKLDYRYAESGRGAEWKKTTDYFQATFKAQFNLTRNTSVVYSQKFNLRDGQTINNSVRIERKLHCWTGSLFWVPTGSTRGFGFKLYVTALPNDIKIDNNHDGRSTSIFNRY